MSDNEQKNEKREALAAIVAEMRKDIPRVVDAKIILRNYSDRIEAAWKREKAEIEADALAAGGIVEAARRRGPTTEKSSEVGNAAALREALEAILKEANTQYWNDNGIDLTWLMEKAKAALSAPARNCDLPLVADGPADNNADKAWLVFKKHNPDAYFDVSGLLRCIDWLLAPAEERKGETDGR